LKDVAGVFSVATGFTVISAVEESTFSFFSAFLLRPRGRSTATFVLFPRNLRNICARVVLYICTASDDADVSGDS